jgi:hypothetical protein
VGALPCARVAGLPYLILGLAFGAIVSLFASGGSLIADRSDSTFVGMMFGAGAIVILPICYAILGLECKAGWRKELPLSLDLTTYDERSVR